MKKSLLVIAIVVCVHGADAAIQYEFRQTTQSDMDGAQPTECTGRAIIDGERSRVEFTSGNVYPAGTVVITRNGSRTLTFIDPSKKAYADVNASAVASAIGSNKIVIANKKIELTQLTDHPTIAGIPTDHYRLSISYDITVTFANLPLTQTIHALIDKWTTMAFGDVGEMFLSGNALRTGNADIDDLFRAENTKIKGMPLKETVTITAINHRAPLPGSQLALSRTVTTTREMTITSIQPVAQVAASSFLVPAGFHQADPLHDDTEKQKVEVLSLDPPQAQ